MRVAMLKKWFSKEAKRYQFWLPQSGSSGGVILGVIILIINELSK